MAQERVRLSGRVTDTRGEPIEFVNVFVRSRQQGTFTDRDGRFVLDLFPGSQLQVEVSHISYKGQIETITLEAGKPVVLNLRLENRQIEGVEILEDRTRRSSMERVPIKDIKVNPSVQQGIESVLVSQLGVQMSNELSSVYSVRGGSYAENLVYVNDIEVYRPFLARSGEQEGLSFPNPDMVGSIYFSAGGFDARYGDRMSSVLDIQYKRPERFGGSVTASMLGGSTSVEGASKDRRFTHITGVRYLTNQYILGSLDTRGDYRPNFTDVQSYWTYAINKKWEVQLLGNYSSNNYRFLPSTRQTQFGSINEALRLTVFFEGQENTSFITGFGAVSTEYKPNLDTRLKFTASVFSTIEDETFDIQGAYRLEELERNLGDDQFGDVVRGRGVGGYINHARNQLDAQVVSFQHRGFKTIDNKYLQWGFTWQTESLTDRLSEWNYVDSAGYSTPINPRDQILLQDVIKGGSTIHTQRLMGYVQNTWDLLLPDESELTATVGVRAHYWDYNGETVLSPRGTVAWQPKWFKQLNDSTRLRRDVVFRFSSGYYYQPAFYRELRAIDGTLNPNNRAQRSIHFVLGSDVNFKMWERPFKFMAEAYYKDLEYLVPYEIDNIRLRYYGDQLSRGYAAGLDMKIHGEFIPGIESWANLSFLKTEEDIYDDFYYRLFNSDGQEIITGFTANNVPVDSLRVDPGFIPRPTDRRVFFSMFFQDEMPNFPGFRVHLSVLYGTGLPFGPPDFQRWKDTERYRSYRRVDIGFSKDLMPKTPGKGPFGKFKSAVISLEVWNLFDINNTISYTWVRESQGRLYGVPNFLTPRRLNLKLAVSF
jgi:hypothetical protein